MPISVVQLSLEGRQTRILPLGIRRPAEQHTPDADQRPYKETVSKELSPHDGLIY